MKRPVHNSVEVLWLWGYKLIDFNPDIVFLISFSMYIFWHLFNSIKSFFYLLEKDDKDIFCLLENFKRQIEIVQILMLASNNCT